MKFQLQDQECGILGNGSIVKNCTVCEAVSEEVRT